MSQKNFRSGAAPTGEELDRRMREILDGVTQATALDATSKLIDLGFAPVASFDLVVATLLGKVKHARAV